ncbi:prealbumin-like fold domain-containing protein [Cellulomonas wangsupingiae]|uniref:SpaA-like prealbumin fold domain-containing protein n=1 Tax=Cellulomonas wangsupingiae TaxID=2968085 RepID=A0ABY5K1Q5_9CELL|nr:hypothetical protein [Cellulomonas wangsupingiae]MCC2335960.1 hypothetical protein [Cellulomonas wangsupingiae]UUI64184.1 hypothetical protein NP075_13735 [Cellulomonas wangsupingiae]
MRENTTAGRRARLRRRTTRTAASIALALVLAPVVGVATAPSAAAVPVTIGPVEADLRGHRGTDGNGTLVPATDNAAAGCVRYSPAPGTPSRAEVRVGHGREQVDSRMRVFVWGAWSHHSTQCPDVLGTERSWDDGRLLLPTEYRTAGQSTLGFAPATVASVPTGTSFLVGTLRYANNPTQSVASHYEGALGLRLGTRGTLAPTYVLRDTAAGDDTLAFGDLTRTFPVVHDGIEHRLTVEGFTAAGSGAGCGAAPTGTPTTGVTAPHGAVTTACLWARLDQVRPLTIVQQAAAVGDAPASVPPGFSVTAERGAAPAARYTLSPTAVTGPGSTVSTAAGTVLARRERVVLTADAPAASWELSSITCRDGRGAVLAPGATVGPGARSVVLENVPEAATAAAAPLVCTFVSSYVAPTTLTLVGVAVPEGAAPGAGVPTAGWEFTVDALGAAPLVTGPGGSAAATVAVPDATRVVRVTEAVPAGYVVDTVTCRRDDGGAAAVTATGNPYDVRLERGRSHTCTVVNLRPGVEVVTQTFLADDTAFASPIPTGERRPAGTHIVRRYTVRNTGQTTLVDIRLRDAYAAVTVGGATTTGDAAIACPGRTDIPAGTSVTIPSLAPGQEIGCRSRGVL